MASQRLFGIEFRNTKWSRGKILVLAPRRQFGYAVRDALTHLEVPAHSFFREEALDEDDTQQAFTLLSLLAKPEGPCGAPLLVRFRVVLLCEVVHGRGYGIIVSGQEKSLAVALEHLASRDLSIPYTGKLVDRFQQLQCRLGELRIRPRPSTCGYLVSYRQRLGRFNPAP